ncbi:MAG: response regulator [Candidatus Hydrogenedentes bacterium]|nr:response regulator [Candidatus Hydrogenedentota bacterium]
MTEQSKILVVDDEAVIRELMGDILQEEGYPVEAVSNGQAALDLLQKQDDFVLLFTDIMMPEMDGIQLIREARKLKPTLIPIVMTGFATLETARAAVKEGAYDYVLKPFSLSEIKLAVANALERCHLANENARLREVTELFTYSEQVVRYRDEHALLDFVLKAALDRVSAQRGSIMLTSRDGRVLEVAASHGLPEEAIRGSVDMGKGISGLVAARGASLLVEDIKKDPEIAERSRQLQEGSFISVPLERKEPVDGWRHPLATGNSPRVLAVLNVSCKRNGRQFNEGDLKTLNVLANHASIAIENVRLINDIEQSHLSTLTSMALLIEAKDPYTHGHSQRVRDLSVLGARRLGLPQHEIELLNLGAGLHDIGKIGVNDGILNKREPLSDQEWEMIRLHPLIGYDVLEPVYFLTAGHLDLVRHHHERLDGKGYPDGLQGDQISEIVRILSVADAFDAMSSSRAYRHGMPGDRIIQELKRCSGAQFDPRIANVFIEMIQEGEIHLAE